MRLEKQEVDEILTYGLFNASLVNCKTGQMMMVLQQCHPVRGSLTEENLKRRTVISPEERHKAQSRQRDLMPLATVCLFKTSVKVLLCR